MSSALFSGVDHVGVGVSDMDEGIATRARRGAPPVSASVPGTSPVHSNRTSEKPTRP